MGESGGSRAYRLLTMILINLVSCTLSEEDKGKIGDKMNRKIQEKKLPVLTSYSGGVEALGEEKTGGGGSREESQQGEVGVGRLFVALHPPSPRILQPSYLGWGVLRSGKRRQE